MGIVPQSRLGKVEFYEAHLTPWTANSAAIGLTAGQVTALQGLTVAARAAYNSALVARQAAESATADFHDAVGKMHGNGSGLLSEIKTYAQTTGNPGVYNLAQIPQPKPPVPAGAPTTPADLSAAMDAQGAIVLRWSGSLAQRQFFSVWRQLPGEATPAPIGSVAAKEFTDATVPRGLEQVAYHLRAQRDAAISPPSATLTVYFGAVGAGVGEGNGEVSVNGQVIGFVGGGEEVAEAA